MSSAFTHQDVVDQTVASLLTARRLKALRTVLCDETSPSHAELVAVADMLLDSQDEPLGLGRCVVCAGAGATWDGREYVHDDCLTDAEYGEVFARDWYINAAPDEHGGTP